MDRDGADDGGRDEGSDTTSDGERMDIGGRATSTPGAGTRAAASGGGGGGGPGGQQEIGGGGSGADGGAVEEMDQDGSDVGGSSRGASGAHGGAATPENWEQMSGTQRQKWHKHRRKKEIKARAASMDLSRFVR